MKILYPNHPFSNFFLKLILAFSIFWMCLNFCLAQTQIPELIETSNELPFQNTNLNTKSELELIQQGNLNQASILQNRNFQNGLVNQAILIQTGNGNNMDIIQTSSHAIIKATQNGVNNNLDLVADGENLNMTFWQFGNDNEIKQTLNQSTDIELTLIQNGDNHLMEQSFNNETGLNMTIIQSGQNARIIVNHN